MPDRVPTIKTTPLRVAGPEDGTTLQDLLAARLEVSRGRAKAMLDCRNVLVNGRPVWMAKHVLRKGDVVTLPGAASVAATPPSALKVPVLLEDPAFLVVSKPPGILSDGRTGVEGLLRDRRAEPDLRAAHRLDRDTSGCLLLARTPEAFDRFVELFREHLVFKRYHALVSGIPLRRETEIRSPVDGLPALTKIRVVDSAKSTAHVLAVIVTGRTHQIRKHLAAIRHPVLGDRSYGRDRASERRAPHVPRQMLHAFEIAFPHPLTAAKVRVTCPLPRDFAATMRSLGLT